MVMTPATGSCGGEQRDAVAAATATAAAAAAAASGCKRFANRRWCELRL
jgi:hypothetical protein